MKKLFMITAAVYFRLHQIFIYNLFTRSENEIRIFTYLFLFSRIFQSIEAKTMICPFFNLVCNVQHIKQLSLISSPDPTTNSEISFLNYSCACSLASNSTVQSIRLRILNYSFVIEDVKYYYSMFSSVIHKKSRK